MIVFKKFVFYAAHRVSRFGQQHKCNTLHGHTYRLTVWAKTSVEAPLEFASLEERCLPVIKDLDHKTLNDIPELQDDPTTERLASYIASRLRYSVVIRIELQETETSGVILELP